MKNHSVSTNPMNQERIYNKTFYMEVDFSGEHKKI